jgi:ribosomal protein L11 methyltransferase
VIRLAVRVRREDAEVVLAQLLDLAPAGVEEVDAGGGVVEYAVYGAPGELPHLPALRAAAGGALVEVATEEVPDDWGERWRSFHRPVLLEAPVRPPAATPVPGLHVRPPWAPPTGRADVEEIVIDPGQAFGTGAHATTRLCLELLLASAAAGDGEGVGRARGDGDGEAPVGGRGPLLDVGTGSGVLAIAAARLGYAPVLALDHDPAAVAAATANAAVNGVAVAVARFDLRREPLPLLGGGVAPTVLANLLRPLLLDLARALDRAPADMIVGGLLDGQVDEVVAAFAERGLRERGRRASGEWAAAWLTRTG